MTGPESPPTNTSMCSSAFTGSNKAATRPETVSGSAWSRPSPVFMARGSKCLITRQVSSSNSGFPRLPVSRGRIGAGATPLLPQALADLLLAFSLWRPAALARACLAVRAAAIRAHPAGCRVAAADLVAAQCPVCSAARVVLARRVVAAGLLAAARPVAMVHPARPVATAHPAAWANPAVAAAPADWERPAVAVPAGLAAVQAAAPPAAAANYFGAAGPVDAAGCCGSDCSEPDWRDAGRVAR